ncbi:hypothetical protein CHS0354_039497 [Potamilus streckersoni]|uniref:Uncharacterized protein n=1 Tax=Potamilus streckersoni TaxID=2493646 RepID=A0AAE0WEE8_9BIVA|nr:hypothetical protein CHS0354_039497 [Potamilus streckersoni]
MVMTVWRSVTQITISNCFRHVQVIPTPIPTTSVEDIDDGDDMPLKTGQQLNDVDNLTLISMGEVPDNVNEENDDANPPPRKTTLPSIKPGKHSNTQFVFGADISNILQSRFSSETIENKEFWGKV